MNQANLARIKRAKKGQQRYIFPTAILKMAISLEPCLVFHKKHL